MGSSPIRGRRSRSRRSRSGRAGRRPWATILPMTIPGRVDAASLLLSLDPPDWFMRHARAVAEIAAFLAAKIEARGTALDRRLVEAAGLLHDIDKIVPEGDRARALPHGDGSADWLTRQGHPELARAVAAHPVTRLLDGEAYKRWSSFASREERIVAYADKRAAQRLESMDARFASWRQRYPRVSVADGQDAGWEDDALKAVRRRADRLEADVCRAAGIEPSEVGQSALDGRGAQGRASGGRHMTTSPLLYVWGDDDLSLGRTVDRFAEALAYRGRDAARALGPARARWPAAAAHLAATPRADRDAGDVRGRDARGRVQRRGVDGTTVGRDAMLAAVGLLAPGNALVILDETKSGAKAPSQKRAVRRGHGSRRLGQELPVAQGQRACRLDRARGPRPGPAAGAGCGEGDRASGSAASSRRTTRRASSRPGTRRWSSTSSRCIATPAPISIDDVRALVPEAAAGLDLGVRRRGRRTEDRAGAGAPRAAACRDPRTGPGRRPAPAGPRAAGAGRSAGRRCEPRDRGAGDGHQQRVPGRHPRGSGPQLDHRRSSPTRSTGSSTSMR